MAMATKILTFPFIQGQDEDTTAKELPLGKMNKAINVRQRRGAMMGQRPDYSSLAMTEFAGQGLDAYDIYNLNGRLIALGDNNDTFYATDVYEYVNATQAAWRSTSGATFNFRVPPVTKVRNIGQPPDGVASVATAKCAAVNGQVCMVYSVAGSVGGLASYIIVVDPDTDATLFFSTVPLTNAKVVGIGTSFWVLGVNAANDIAGYRIQTTVTTSLPSPVTLFTGTVNNQIFDCAPVTNTGTINQFVFFIRNGASTTRIERYNEAGSQQAAFAGPAVAADSLCIEADSTNNTIVVATRVGTADVNLSTYNLTTNALTVGPTAIFGQAVTGDISIARQELGASSVDVAAEDSSRVVRIAAVTTGSHTTSLTEVHNCLLGGKGCIADNGATILPLLGSTDNMLLLCVPAAGFNVPVCSTDVGIAEDAPTLVHLESPGQVTKDFGTGKHYWCRLIEGTDGQVIPIMSEFLYGDTGRRQGCQIGNELFLTGGIPLIYDGRQVSESGFLGRPTFNGAIANNTGGSLIPGATYDYCIVWKWTDSQNLLVQSAVSEVRSHTMGASNTATTVDIFTPHTLRRDSTTGSTATVSLYRTIADGQSTAGVVISARDFALNPAVAGDFNAKTLVFAVDGGGNQTVTFGASDNTVGELISAINTQTTGCTASLEGNGFKITSDTTGTSSSINITGGSSVDVAGTAADSGFFSGQIGTGTSTFTRGTVFHLTQSFYVPLSNPLGASLTVFDDTPDSDLPTQPTLYTQGERGALSGILEHNPPQPCEYCWPVGNRVFIGGLPNRSEVRISKALFPAESLAFSDDFSFSSFVDGDVTAVGSLDGTPIAFTRDAVYAFSNQLPDDNGNGATTSSSGTLGEPIRIPSEGGCINPFSLVEVSFGLFYQSLDNKLMLLPRGGGSPVWAGAPMQDTLELFPNITGAAYCDINHTITWACRNTGGSDAVMVVLDIKTGQWSVDTFSPVIAAVAVSEYQGRSVVLDNHTVKLESLSRTPNTFIEYELETGSHQPFQGNGWGKLVSVTVDSIFRGNCQFRLRVSFDDGVTYQTLKTFSYTTAGGFVAGQTIKTQWWPGQRKCSQYVLDFQVLVSGSTASPGLDLNKYTVELEGSFPQRIRTSQAQRG